MNGPGTQKKLKKTIGLAGLIFLALIGILLIIFFFFWRQLQVSSWPVYSGQVKIPGLIEPVEVIRDQYGVPHLLARHETDLYRATGYVMAQDRLWQMDLIRRITSGRLAEIFGREFIETDLFLRALRIPEKAHRVLASSPGDALEALEAFSEGVNVFIETHKNRLPMEFRLLRYHPEPWQPEHSASLIGYIGWDLAFAWGIESIIWQIQEKLKDQEEKLLEILAGPVNPVYVYSGFSLTQKEDEPKILSLINPGERRKRIFTSFTDQSSLFKTPESEWIKNGTGKDAGQTAEIDFLNLIASPELSKSSSLAFEKIKTSSLIEAAELLKVIGLTILMNSNNWAISGEKSLTGKPIVANDMHLSLSLPSIWYPLHQSVEGKFRVSGVALPGEPFIVAGHNEHIAWGMTNVMADDIDFYLEKVDPEKPNYYFFEGEWRPMEVRKEKIRIKGGKESQQELRFTHRGPVISEFKDIKDRVISMRWTGYEDSNELLAVYLLNRATNWMEFRKALAFFRSLALNVIYADVEGNIGLQLAGGIPRRPGPGFNLFPGESATSDWTDLIPFDDLPFVFNPPENLVVSANNKSVDESYPYPISYFFLSSVRAERIREFLMEKDKVSPQEMARLQMDIQSKLAQRLKPLMVNILLNLSGLSELESTALQLLRGWDGSMETSSPAPTLFEILYFEFGRQLVIDELGEELSRRFIALGSNALLPGFLEQTLTLRKSAWSDDVTTSDRVESVEDILARSFRSTINYLIKTRGRDIDSWQWGKLHQLTFVHPLGNIRLLNWLFRFNRGAFPVGGSFHTVCAFGYSSGSFQVKQGPSQRHIYDLHDWDESLTILPGGVSGLSSSPHFDDQILPYLNGEYRQDIFSEDKIKQSARYRLMILPENRVKASSS